MSDLKQASLPIMAALGGVAVPTATGVAFAVGVLALLDRSIPANVRVFLLALAIIDDIIALFYSGGLDCNGFLVAGLGIALALGFRQIGIGSAFAYVLPGAITWIGLLAGIGLTMSIFIAMLAFNDEALLGAAKLGVLLGSLVAAILGLVWGVVYRRTSKPA